MAENSKQQSWNDQYIADPTPWPEPDSLLVEEVGKLPTGNALDLGCGKGADSLWLARQGWRVTGVDFAPAAIEAARREAHHQGLAHTVDVQLGDALSYSAEHRFDLVYIGFMHLPEPQRSALFENAGNAVAPGGCFLYVGFAADNPLGRVPAPPECRVMPEQVSACFPGFTICRSEVIRRRVPMRYHTDRVQRDAHGKIDVNTVIVRLERPA